MRNKFSLSGRQSRPGIGRTGRAALATLLALGAMGSAFAGSDKSFKSIDPAPAPWWSATLSTGWDSLYMFRGVNQLAGFQGYGSSISWTSAALTFNPGTNDSLEIGTWSAFGLSESDYKEIDATAVYTHTFGNLSVSLGYALYAVLNAANGLYSHELSAAAAYELRCGPLKLTPGLEYDFNAGPAPGNRGYVEQGSSYLQLRVDGEISICRDRVSLAPWAAAGFNFRYNTTEKTGTPSPFVGANHAEFGISVPVAVTAAVSVTPYVAYSYQWNQLTGTRPDTFWGGAAVVFTF